MISGTISAGDAANGPFSATVIASNGAVSDSQTFNWNVNPKVAATAVNDQSAVEGDTVSLQVTASESGATLSYSATGLPAGLSINSSTGLISGTVSTGDASHGPYSVDVKISDGTYTSDVAYNLSVTDGSTTPPTLSNPGSQVNVVGDSVNMTVSASDSDGGALSYSVAGLPDGLNIDLISGIISGAVAEDAVSAAPYSVTITATDNNSGLTATQTFSWIVNDSALTVQAGTFTVTEGADATVTMANFTNSDPNWTSDAFVASINWGDGTTDDNVSGNALVSGSNGAYAVTDDHVYASPGTYHPVVEISDGYETVTETGTATVSTAPLSLTGGFMQGAVAGSTVSADWAAFTDGNPDTNSTDFTATINWGDDTSSSGTVTGSNGAFAVSGSHNYASKGSYAVTAEVSDTDGSSGTVTSTAQVGDLVAGEQSTLTVASFKSSDPSAIASQFTATINWGDGSALDTSVTVTESAGLFTVQGNHAYEADSHDQTGGAYVVTVTVDGPQNEVISATKNVSVVRPIITGFADNEEVLPNVSFSNLKIASFIDPDATDVSSEFTATIFWGDGSSSVGVIAGAGGVFDVLGSHIYTTTGDYAVQVEVSQAWSSFLIALTTSASIISADPKAVPFKIINPSLVAEKETLSKFDDQIKGSNPYTELAKATFKKLQNSAELKNYDFPAVKNLGPFNAPIKANATLGIAQGAYIYPSFLFFEQWDYTGNATGVKIVIQETTTYVDSTQNEGKEQITKVDPISFALTNEPLIKVVSLKDTTKATSRIITADAPGTKFQVKVIKNVPPPTASYRVEGTVKLVTADNKEVPNSAIKFVYYYSFNPKPDKGAGNAIVTMPAPEK